MKSFSEWLKIKLNEVGTCTSSVAVFSRPIFGSEFVRRTWADFIALKEKPKIS